VEQALRSTTPRSVHPDPEPGNAHSNRVRTTTGGKAYSERPLSTLPIPAGTTFKVGNLPTLSTPGSRLTPYFFRLTAGFVFVAPRFLTGFFFPDDAGRSPGPCRKSASKAARTVRPLAAFT
jgi:hypothetical protein